MDDPTLNKGEPHPSAVIAKDYLQTRLTPDIVEKILSISDNNDSNRLAKVCAGTVRRIQKGQPVSDRYLLGLFALVITVLDAPMFQESWDGTDSTGHTKH